jgi:hypothetical protein
VLSLADEVAPHPLPTMLPRQDDLRIAQD